MSNACQKYLRENGIIQHFSCLDTSSQNSLSKCKIRHLVKMLRTFLIHAHMPHSYWVDALLSDI